ncbi:MAG: 2-succinyl-5-enolpyruvyl-6-hydroxy-3-cyclohexene-1-carboxylic-acid synthase, partial [Vibrionaceae bacterium]
MKDNFSLTQKEFALQALDQATLNRIWARLILQALYRQGVRHFCIAPGSRSTPLTLEAQRLSETHPDVTLHTHFDERGLGFLALGLAKASLQPVAVIVTSGTAVANLLPAVAESALTGEPLILLTADRPCDQIQCGANQAIVQTHIFGEQVSVAYHLPAPSVAISPAWLLSTLSQKLALQHQLGGSLHINCPYPEPLYGEELDAADALTAAYLEPVHAWLQDDKPYVTYVAPNLLDHSALQKMWQALAGQKGILLIGKIDADAQPALLALAQKLGWPVLCDPQSGVSCDHAGFDGWLLDNDCRKLLLTAQCVIQFGARLVSKRLTQFLAQFRGAYWLVAPYFSQL